MKNSYIIFLFIMLVKLIYLTNFQCQIENLKNNSFIFNNFFKKMVNTKTTTGKPDFAQTSAFLIFLDEKWDRFKEENPKMREN